MNSQVWLLKFLNTRKFALKLLMIMFFIVLYLYGAFQHSTIVNTDMHSFDQSAYMNYAKKLHYARHIDKEIQISMLVEAINDLKNKYHGLSKEKKDEFLNKAIKEAFRDFYNLNDNEKLYVSNSLKKIVLTTGGELGEMVQNVARILHNSRSYLFGEALDGNRMPLYPMIQSLFYNDMMADLEFFNIGKKINIILSLLMLLLISFVFLRKFSLHFSLNIIMIITFNIFIFKAAFFQCELLFYFLNFLSFVLFINCFSNLSFINSFFAGFLSGVTYLTKASMLPGFVLFICFLVVKNIITKSSLKKLLKILIIIVAFYITVFSFITENKNKYGSFFYNVNSSVYMWKSSWNKIYQEKENRFSLKDNPSYLAKNKTGHFPFSYMINRLFAGTISLWSKTMATYGYRKYIVIYIVFMIFVFFMNIRKYIELYRRNLFVVTFAFTYFLSYILLYAWYIPIAAGNRLVLSIFIPILFSFTVFLKNKHVNKRVKYFFSNKLEPFLNVFISIIILIDIYFILNHRIFTIFGGS